MKHRRILGALAACCGVAFTGLPAAVPVAGDLAASKAYADGSRRARAYYAGGKGRRAARGRRYARRGGYYSYTDRDVISTLLWPPFPYQPTVSFGNPWRMLQTSAGPFDSGFWFDSGIGPPWNNTPYPR